MWKSASFCWFYTCDPFQLGACQFLCSEKEWVVYFGSLSPHNFWFYRLLWHLLSSVFYRVHDPNCSLHRHCSMTCCPQMPQESYRASTQKFVEIKQGMTAVCTFLLCSPSSHHSQLRFFLIQKGWTLLYSFASWMLWPFIMLSILWQQSSSPHLLLPWRGTSSACFWTSIWLLGSCLNLWYWKSHWRVNSKSSFLAC